MDLLAHRDADGNVQTLHGHLHGAGDLAESYESEFSQISRWQRFCMMLERLHNSFKRI